MKIAVTGLGVVSALGTGVRENMEAMRAGRTGISLSPEILVTGNRLPVGEIKLTNEELAHLAGVPEKAHLSRTALLGILAVREAMADARIPEGLRVGLVSSTSVGGMDLTEHFFVQFIENPSSGRLRDVRMHDCCASTDAIADYCNINILFQKLLIIIKKLQFHIIRKIQIKLGFKLLLCKRRHICHSDNFV